jgi:hypothetical protein
MRKHEGHGERSWRDMQQRKKKAAVRPEITVSLILARAGLVYSSDGGRIGGVQGMFRGDIAVGANLGTN